MAGAPETVAARSIDAMGNRWPLHAWLLVASVGLVLALIGACGSEAAVTDEALPSATVATSPTVLPSPTPLASPTPIPTPRPLLSLEEALAGGELLALRPLLAPDLVYAVKEGHHVTVFHRDINTGQEEVLLEYSERVEARHSSNLWQELPPSVALNPAEHALVYGEDDAVIAYDVDESTSRTLLRRGDTGLDRDDSRESVWLDQSGAEQCCAYGLALPVVSRDGSWVVLSMQEWEGSRLLHVRSDGTKACLAPMVPDQGAATSLHPAWGPQGDLLIPSGGAYAAPGLFVAPANDPCTYRNLAEGMHDDLASFEAAAWSPDGNWIVASMSPGTFEKTNVSLVLMRRDGSEGRTLVEASFNLWPRFSPDGRHVYFIRSEDWIDKFEPTPQSLLRYDLDSGETVTVAEIPDGWSARPQGWTAEGYLMLLVYGGECGYYWGCRDRLVLLDVATGGVVYASESADFTNYLGFLQRK